jgi:PTH2 family peptidyl-tRNA hydrolase
MIYKMAVVVRSDLGMGKGKIAAQAAHACVHLATSFYSEDHEHLVGQWLTDGQRKVVLKVANLAELEKVREDCLRFGMPCAVIQDRGLTQVEPGTVTCMGIGPDLHEKIDKITAGLKLL